MLQLLMCDKGIISVSAQSVHLASRRGLAQWHLRYDSSAIRSSKLISLSSGPDMIELSCMSFTAKGTSEVLVAGHQYLFRIDTESGVVLDKVIEVLCLLARYADWCRFPQMLHTTL